jgi:AcrR family transcriptional regulator
MAGAVKPAGRTRKRLGGAREQALLDVALALLAEVGYDRMSLDEVARRAHTSKLTALCIDRYLSELVKLQSAGALQQDIASIITRAVERDELSSGSAEHTATIAEVVHALIVDRLLLSQTPLDASYIEHVVDAILLPILRAP